MKITTGLLAGAAVLAMAQTAQAAPRVSGTYILMSFSQCQAQFTTTTDNFKRQPTGSGPGVATLNSAQNGEINIAVGSINFQVAASGASTGSAQLEMSIVSGGSLKINTSGNAIGTHTENVTGTFTVTDTTFTFDPNGAEPAMTWTMRAGNFANTNLNGIARTMYLTRRENARCISALTATKQVD